MKLLFGSLRLARNRAYRNGDSDNDEIQSEIGSQIGKSVSTVHRIEKQAHEKLRKWLLD
jgi:DNA-directed RNA polymerase specialized sigma subunit